MADDKPDAKLSPNDLNAAEQQPAAGQVSDSSNDEASWFDRTAEKSDERFKVFLKKHKLGVSFGLAASLVAGGVFTLTILSGPLKFIHFAQALTSFHLQEGQDQSDDRLSVIFRYIREPNKPQNTRMGTLGNLLADRAEKRMNASGVESSYTRAFGFLNGYTIDPDKLGGEFESLRGQDKARIVAYFKDRYDITLEDHPHSSGKLYASAQGMGYTKTRKLTKTLVRSANYGGIVGAVQTRIMGKRGGVDWHPIRRLDAALLKTFDQRYTAWKNQKEAAIQGVEAKPQAETRSSANPDEEGSRENSASAENATKEILEQGRAVGAEAAKGNVAEVEQLEASLRSKIGGVGGAVGGGLLTVTGALCTVQFIYSSYEAAKTSAVVGPTMRMGMEMITLGFQVMDGKDIDLEQLEFYNDLLYDPKTGTSVSDAPSWQHNDNKPITGTETPEVRLDNNRTFMAEILGLVPGLDRICTVQENPFVQGGLFAISFAGGPISAVLGAGVGIAASKAMETYLPQIIGYLVGRPIDTFAQGAKRGSYMDHGVFHASNDIGASAGGVPLSTAQATALRSMQLQDEREAFQSKNLAHRLFNPYDRHTLAAKIIDAQPASATQAFASLRSGLDGIFGLPAKLFGQLFFTKAYALNPVPYNYGVPSIGTSLEDMSNKDIENPFANASVVINGILPGPDGQTFIDRAKVCNGIILTLDGKVLSSGQPPTYDDMTKPENKCAEQNENWLRVRFYIKDTQLLESAACYEGSAEACVNIDFPTGALTDPPTAEGATNEQARSSTLHGFGTLWPYGAAL